MGQQEDPIVSVGPLLPTWGCPNTCKLDTDYENVQLMTGKAVAELILIALSGQVQILRVVCMLYRPPHQLWDSLPGAVVYVLRHTICLKVDRTFAVI